MQIKLNWLKWYFQIFNYSLLFYSIVGLGDKEKYETTPSYSWFCEFYIIFLCGKCQFLTEKRNNITFLLLYSALQSISFEEISLKENWVGQYLPTYKYFYLCNAM